jgi:hypothetical protein
MSYHNFALNYFKNLHVYINHASYQMPPITDGSKCSPGIFYGSLLTLHCYY